jgi:hypothetical protein
MKKDDLNAYLNRWALVRRVEDEELKNASVELMVCQTLSIWDIARTLGLTEPSAPEDRSWQLLQQKWLEIHAGKQ